MFIIIRVENGEQHKVMQVGADMVTFWPKPDKISGTQVVWNSPAVPASFDLTIQFANSGNPVLLRQVKTPKLVMQYQ